jgi:hypothetical protein
MLENKGVKLREFDYFLAKQFITSTDGRVECTKLAVLSRISGYHLRCDNLDGRLSHLGFVLTYGLGTKISVQYEAPSLVSPGTIASSKRPFLSQKQGWVGGPQRA